MKKIYTTLLSLLVPMMMMGQNITGWPANYGGVMLQGFYWDSFSATQWTKLTNQADELAATFDLIWVPQSGNCDGQSMGYDDFYWFPGGNHYTSSFGTEQELRTMISTFKEKGLGTIADVVVNHRKNVSNWVDFPAETYKGVTYQLQSTDICRNDDGGATLTWANNNGYSLSSNDDSGEGWDGMRDLDHHSENVQNTCKAYTKMLLDDLGYVGFRYDMVKGFWALYVRDYNNYAKPQFSVGECWDSSSTISGWIDYAENTSAAFDFQCKYVVRNAVDNNDWRYLGYTNDGNHPLVSSSYKSGNYRQYAVTFVENHDTEVRPNGSSNGPLTRDTLAANAYMLAMPGTPCVFMKHWMAYKQDIKAMVAVRKAAGITNTSNYSNMRSNTSYYANLIKNENGTSNLLQVVVGSDLNSYVPSTDQWTKVLSGYHYAYYLPNTMETAWADKADGEFEDVLKVKLTAVSSSTSQLVYTINGSTPTASSTKVNSGTEIEITDDCILTVGLLVGSSVTGIVKRTYTKAVPEDTKDITVYVQAPGWSIMYFYAWDSDGQLLGGWPGTQITDKQTVGGKQWYYHTFQRSVSSPKFNIIFDKGSGGANQTVDIENITEDKYYTINASVGGDKMTVNDVTSQYTGIAPVTIIESVNRIYTLDGRLMPTNDVNALPRGIYIVNGKKIVK